MRCPYCDSDDSKVVDSRAYSGGYSIKRRRECLKCKKRFTTYENIEQPVFYVVKKDGTREEFKKEKILKGLVRATVKRDIEYEILEKLVLEIEKELHNNLASEVNSKILGNIIMEKLKKLDEVAYVRFASVYKEFKDVKSFVKEIEELNKNMEGKS
jgi:transcriptional repressor NrdR